MALIHPVLDAALEQGISGPELLGQIRRCFILRAFERLPRHPRSGRPPTSNRVALATDFTRAAVSQAVSATTRSPRERDWVDRLIEGWRKDRRFRAASGRPAPLPLKATRARPSLEDLARTYAPSQHVGSLLHELVRRGRVDRDALDRVRLRATRRSPA